MGSMIVYVFVGLTVTRFQSSAASEKNPTLSRGGAGGRVMTGL